MTKSECRIYGTISMRNLSKLHIHAQMSFHLHGIFHAAERVWGAEQSEMGGMVTEVQIYIIPV